MNKTIVIFFILAFSLVVSSCAKKEPIADIKPKENPSLLYPLAMEDIYNRNYSEAILKFENIIYKFPLSNEGIQSQIMIAFIDYLNLNYIDAIYKFDKIIKLYPSHKNIDYAYYMRALCYFEQIQNESVDGFNNKKALSNFNELLNKYPNSEYSQDSRQKIIFINEIIAGKHMNIGMFYLKQKKYLAAINRYNKVINEHEKSKFTAEALYRLTEIYLSLGLFEDAKKTAAVISYNYPESKWYEYAYKLINKENKLEDKLEDTSKKKKSLKEKILNIF